MTNKQPASIGEVTPSLGSINSDGHIWTTCGWSQYGPAWVTEGQIAPTVGYGWHRTGKTAPFQGYMLHELTRSDTRTSIGGEEVTEAMIAITLEMVAAGEAEFRQRCGNALPESKAECEASAIAIYTAMHAARTPDPSTAEKLEGVRTALEDLRDERNFPAHLLGIVDDLLEHVATLKIIGTEQG